MDPTSLSGREVAVDVETDMEESSLDDIAGYGARRTCRNPTTIWSGFANANESINGDNTSPSRGFPGSFGVYIANKELIVDKTFMDKKSTSILDRKNSGEKPKKKNFNKPLKPPRPPKALSLASSEEKLVREISELAKLKRARMERMKALKKMKNVNTSSGSTSNLWALIVTVLFCFVIFWQGLSSSSSSDLVFEGSPVLSAGNKEGLISVHFYNNGLESNSSNSTS